MHGQRAFVESLLSSSNQVLYAGFVAAYLLDGVLLELVVKCVCECSVAAALGASTVLASCLPIADCLPACLPS